MPIVDFLRRSSSFPLTQRETADLIVRDAKTRGSSRTEYPCTAGAAVVEAHVEAQCARALRRPATRWHRVKARADAVAAELAHEKPPGGPGGPDAPASRALVTLDPFVTSLMALAFSVLLVGVVLEATGTKPSLAIWETTLSGRPATIALSICIGVVFMLIGHFAGWLLHLMSSAGRRARLALGAGAVALVVTGVIGIAQVGHGRDVNLNASGKLITSGQLEATADGLGLEADRLDRDARGSRRAVSPPKARALRSEAAELRGRADQLGGEAFSERTLDFFVWVQLCGLVLAVVGGWGHAACNPLRLERRHRKLDRKAAKAWDKAWKKHVAIAALGAQTIALAALQAGQEGAYVARDDRWAERLFWKLMNAPTEVPAPAAAPQLDPFGPDVVRAAMPHNANGASSRPGR